MIKLNGTAEEIFTFPADPLTALSYLSDLNYVVQFLPYIEPVEIYGPNELRVLYSCVELGTYTINAISDLVCSADREEMAIFVQPLKGKEPVVSEASLSATMGYGYFASAAYLEADGDSTRIDFRLKIVANLPRPRGMRMMPGRIVNRIASTMSEARVAEIAEGFMENALADFPAWAQKRGLSLPE